MLRVILSVIFSICCMCNIFAQDTIYVAHKTILDSNLPYIKDFLQSCNNIDDYNGKEITFAVNIAFACSKGYEKPVSERSLLFVGHALIVAYPILEYIDKDIVDSSPVIYAPDYDGVITGNYPSLSYFLLDLKNVEHLKVLQTYFGDIESDEFPTSNVKEWVWRKSFFKYKISVKTKSDGHKHITFTHKTPPFVYLKFLDEFSTDAIKDKKTTPSTVAPRLPGSNSLDKYLSH